MMCSIRNEDSEKRAIFEQAVALYFTFLQKPSLPTRQLMHITTCIRTHQRDTVSHQYVQESRSGPFSISYLRLNPIAAPALPHDALIARGLAPWVHSAFALRTRGDFLAQRPCEPLR